MRSSRSRLAQVAVGAPLLAIPGSAVALTTGQADAQSAIQINLGSRHIAYGDRVEVLGTANAGQTVVLEFARAGRALWRNLASTKVGPHGHFKFAVPLRESGQVRAVDATATAANAPLVSSAIAPSYPRPVSVASDFRINNRSIGVLGSQPVSVRGRLLPEIGGRRVVLQVRAGRGWRNVNSTRTGAHGGFRLRYRAGGLGSRSLRVRFAGDRLNAPAAARAGVLNVFTQSVASWYNDGGATACGFHAHYGVANRTLPCGTRVTFSYGGRTVTAVVDDRGPFVGGRTWDLNQNTAGALGFGGVGTVWATA